MEAERPVVVFDGVCNLCNTSVQFILKHDKEERFLFASLQGKYGSELLRSLGWSTEEYNSLLLVADRTVYAQSNAALRIAGRLPFPWSLTKVFLLVPKGLRDAVYNYIAKNRYKWYGKRESCMMPTPELKARFKD